MTGPKEGSRRAIMVFLPILDKASAKPIVIVDLPSPAGVGLIAVTKINFPGALSFTALILSKDNFALYFPYSSISSKLIPTFSTISVIGFKVILCAMSISVFMRVPNFLIFYGYYTILQLIFAYFLLFIH